MQVTKFLVLVHSSPSTRWLIGPLIFARLLRTLARMTVKANTEGPEPEVLVVPEEMLESRFEPAHHD